MPELALHVKDFLPLYDQEGNVVELQIKKKEAQKLEMNRLLQPDKVSNYTCIRVLGIVGDPKISVVQGSGRYKKVSIDLRKKSAKTNIFCFKVEKGITRDDIEAWRKYRKGV